MGSPQLRRSQSEERHGELLGHLRPQRPAQPACEFFHGSNGGELPQ